MSLENEQSTEQSTDNSVEFDWANPPLLDEDPEQIDAEKDADDIPPPPPDAIYKTDWDFAAPDADEHGFQVRKDKNGKSFLMVNLVGKLIDCRDPNITESSYTNRTVRTNLMSSGFGRETSSAGDWLKSVLPRAEGVALINKINKLRKEQQIVAYRDAIENAIIAGAQGWTQLIWEAQYKRTDDDGKDEYIRPGGKYNNGEKIPSSHPIQRYKGMKNFPTVEKEIKGETIKVKDPIAKFTDPDTGEEVSARANATLKTFIPNRPQKSEEE